MRGPNAGVSGDGGRTANERCTRTKLCETKTATNGQGCPPQSAADLRWSGPAPRVQSSVGRAGGQRGEERLHQRAELLRRGGAGAPPELAEEPPRLGPRDLHPGGRRRHLADRGQGGTVQREREHVEAVVVAGHVVVDLLADDG